MAEFSNYLESKGQNLTDVNVVGVSSNALTGIMKALDKQARLISQLQKGIEKTGKGLDYLSDDLEKIESGNQKRDSDADKAAKSEVTRSVASERRQRAANAAVHGKINKGLSLVDTLNTTLKDIGDKIINLLKDYAKESLRSYDDNARAMRKQFLTTEQISANLLKGDKAKAELSRLGLKVNSGDTKSIVTALVESKADVSKVSEKQIALLTMMNKTAGADPTKALSRVMSLNEKEVEALTKVYAQASDTTGNEAFAKLTASMNERWFTLFEEQSGGTAAAMAALQSASKQLDSALGMYGLEAETQANIITEMAKMQSNQFDKVDTAQLVNILGVSRENLSSPEEFMKGIQNMITRTDISREEKLANLNILNNAGFSDDLTKALAEAIKDEKYEEHKKNIRSEKENVDAINQAQKGGRWGGKVNSVMTGINLATGGLFSKMSAGINEMFGENMGMEEVVSSGFKLVCTLLGTIVASKIIGNPLSLLTKAIGGSAIFGKIKGFFIKDKGENKSPDLPTMPKVPNTPKVPRDLDAEYAEAVKKLKEFPKHAIEYAKESFDKFKAAAGNFKQSVVDSFNRFDQKLDQSVDKFKLSAKNAFNSIKTSFHNAPTTIKKTFSEIKKRGIIAMTKIPGMFKGMGSKIGAGAAKFGKGALAGIGIASGVLGLLGSTGAFDSLTPILEDFSKTIAPVLADVVSTLAPTIQNFLQSMGPVIQDLVKSLAPILDSVLKAIAPVLTKILQSLTPVLDSLFKTLTPVLDSVFKVLTPVIDSLVQTVMPVFSTIIETLMPIVTTVLDVLSPILKTIIDTIGPVIKIIANVATPILKVIGSILKGISPILELVLWPISQALNLITKPLQLVAELLGEKQGNTEAAGDATATKEQAIKNNDLVTAKNAAIVQAAYSQGFDKIERQEGESDEDYYARAVKALEEESNKTSLTLGNRHRRKNLKDILSNTTIENSSQKITDALRDAIEHDKDTFGNTKKDDFYGKDIEDWRKLSPSSLVEELKKIYGEDKDSIRGAVALLKDEKTAQEVKLASGGVFNQATKATVGEAGKEAVVPLERPEDMSKVLNSLTSKEKLALLKALLNKKSSITWGVMGEVLSHILSIGQELNSSSNQSVLDSLPKDGVPGDDQATINRILGFAGPYSGMVYQRLLHGWKGNVKDGFKQRKKWYDEAIANAANQEGRELIAGTYAERALDYGVSELGKPYILRSLGKIGYVCNELVNACIQASGFDMGKFRVHGVKATFANIQKGKYSGSEYPNFRIRDDLTPQTAIPGMVFFQDARKNQEGGFQPGHIGLVYYGHQKLHAAGGSANYTKEGFLPNWQTPCRGVTVTPFDGSNYVIGEFPGLFEQATGDWKLPKGSSIPFGPSCTAPSGSEIKNYSSAEASFSSNVNSAVKKAGLLSNDELNELAKEAGLQNVAAMSEFVKQAEVLLSSNKDKDSIVAILLDIAKYLRGAVTPSKQPMMSVARPAASVYG